MIITSPSSIKKLLFGLAFIFVSALLSAKTKPIYGYFVTQDYDTIECKFDIPFYKTKSGKLKLEFRDIQYKIKAKTKDGTKYKVTPKEYIGFGFAFNYKQFSYQSVTNTLNPKSKNIFLRVDIDGKLKLISHFVKIPGPTTQTYGQSAFYIEFEDIRYKKQYIQKENGELFKLNKSFFRKELPLIISDYSELSDKIGNEDYEYDNIIRVIMEYNEYFDKSSFLL